MDTVSSSSELGTAPASNFGQCMTACDATDGCIATVLDNGTCWMKSSYLGRKTSANLVIAALYNPRNYPEPSVNTGLASSGCGRDLPAPLQAGGNSVTFSFPYAGVARSYNVHVPSFYDPNIPAPLIVSFHGNGEVASTNEKDTGYSGEGWNPFGITVYAQGVNNAWQSDPSTLTSTPYTDDLSFVSALVANLTSSYCIDRKRIWGTGFSNGGGFIGMMACNKGLSSTFSAFAAHSGALYTNTSSTSCNPDTVFTNDIVQPVCSPGRTSLPILEMHGTSDTTINYYGGGRKNQCLPTIPHWVQDWATRNSLSLRTNTTTTPYTGVQMSQFGSGSTLGLVQHMRIANWGHQWASRLGGATFDATVVAMDFFYRNSA